MTASSAGAAPARLPPRLARLYGKLRIPAQRTRPHVFSSFVTTLDGLFRSMEQTHPRAHAEDLGMTFFGDSNETD